MAAVTSSEGPKSSSVGHARWVRLTHWIIAASVLTLAFSGFEILMVHPRLYWGKVGNDLTPALFELPISRNYHHGGWAPPVVFLPGASPVVSAARTYDIFNQNSWGRSLHFLAAWFLVGSGLIYLAAGLASGHLWGHLVPRLKRSCPQTPVAGYRLACANADAAGVRRAAVRAPAEARLWQHHSHSAAAHGADRAYDVAGGNGGLSAAVGSVRRLAVGAGQFTSSCLQRSCCFSLFIS